MTAPSTGRRALLVLGMHRSGTSALARVLNLLGADLGPSLLPANADNEAGFWEPREIVALHDELLAALGSAWHDPRPLPEDALAGEAVRPFRARLEAILRRDFADAPVVGMKDPRLCRLVPLWREVLTEAGLTPAFALTCRHPDEVAASLAARDGMNPAAARLLWLEHVLAAERDSRGAMRAFVTYDGLLRKGRAEAERLAHELGLAEASTFAAAAPAIEAFLDPGLRHQRQASGALPPILADVLHAWGEAVAGKDTDAAFDAIRARLASARELFGPWVDDLEAKRTRDQQRLERRNARIHALTARLTVRDATGTPDADGTPAATTSAAAATTSSASPRLTREGTTILRTFEQPEGAPRVSIVIPLYNQVHLTAKCLESLAARTPDGVYEVILVDNGSTDETPALLGELAGNVKIVANAKNLGFAAACNQGAAMASTPNLLFLNNDIEALPDWLPPLLARLDEEPSVAVVGSKLLFPDGRLQHAGVALLHRVGSPVPLGAFHVHYGEPGDFPPANRRADFQVVTGACLLVRKRIFDEVDGFDEFFWNGCEDVDLCLKVRERGWRVRYEPASVLVHHESKSGAERWSRTRGNETLLASRWFGRVAPDLIQETDGSRRLAEGAAMREDAPESGSASAAGVAPDAVTSILILTRNQLEHTRRCVASLERYTPEPHEIVFVDNGSTDGTREYLESLLARGNVRVVANAGNRGFAAGNNQALSLARGRRIVLLNNDTIVTDGWLGGLSDVLDAHPEAGIVGPMTNYASGPQMLPEVPYRTVAGMEEFAAGRAEEHGDRSTAARRLVGFCWMMRRDVVDSIGGLDETFGAGNCEDDDYCLRAHQHGWKTRIALGVFVHHVGSRTFAGEKIDYRASLERNYGLFKAKWGMPAEARAGEPYPFDDLVAKERRPHVPLPVLRATHVAGWQGRWLEDRARTREAAGVPPARPSTRRMGVGVIGEAEPGDGPRELLARHGNDGPVPRWTTTAQLAEGIGTSGHAFLLGPDCSVPEEAVRELMTLATTVRDLAAVGPIAYAAPEAQRGGPATAKASDFERIARRRRERDAGKLIDVPHLGGFCLLLDAAAVMRAGGLDVSLPIEDALLALFGRLRENGGRVACARGAWVHHVALDATEGRDYDARLGAEAPAAR